MTERITADPARLERFSDETRRTIEPALVETERYATALARYQGARNDLGSACIPDQRTAIEATLGDLATLDELPAAFARALRALDDRVGPEIVLSAPMDAHFDAAVDAALDDPTATSEVLRRVAADDADGDTAVWRLVWDAYDHPTGAYGSVINLVNVGRWGNASARLRDLEARAGIRAPDLRWTGANRAARREMARNIARAAERALPRARASALAADEALRSGRGPLSGVGSRISTRFPGIASGARVLAKPLGVLGVGISAFETRGHLREGEYVDAGFSGAGMAGGALLLFAGGPVTLTAGAVLVLGSLAYEYREPIGDAVRWTGDRIGDAARWTGDRIGDTAGWVGDRASDLGDAVGDTAGAVADFLGL